MCVQTVPRFDSSSLSTILVSEVLQTVDLSLTNKKTMSSNEGVSRELREAQRELKDVREQNQDLHSRNRPLEVNFDRLERRAASSSQQEVSQTKTSERFSLSASVHQFSCSSLQFESSLPVISLTIKNTDSLSKHQFTAKMDNKKNVIKDSFGDRFCDDLTEVIISFLPIEDKFRLQCVSKQFRDLIRVLYQRS